MELLQTVDKSENIGFVDFVLPILKALIQKGLMIILLNLCTTWCYIGRGLSGKGVVAAAPFPMVLWKG